MIRTKGYLLFGATITGGMPITIGMSSNTVYSDFVGTIGVTIPAFDHTYLMGFLEGVDSPTEEDFNLSIPILTISATGDMSAVGSLDFTLPMLQRSIYGHDSIIGTMSVSIPKFTRSIVGVTGIAGTINASTPMQTFSMIGSSGITGTISASIPKQKFYLVAENGITGTLNVSIPLLSSSVSLSAGVIGNLAFSIPIVRSPGDVVNGGVANVSFSLPFFRFTANGLMSCEGVLSATIPMMSYGESRYTIVDAVGDEYANITIVMNIKNKALTQYNNYNFNSMCNFGGKNLGLISTGMYDLTGDTDDGYQIDWNIRTGNLSLEMNDKKRIKQVWISHRTNGNMVLTVVKPNGEEYEYELENVILEENVARVKVGKGIKSKYVKLDLKNVGGSTLLLDALRVHYDVLSKKR